MELKSLIVLNKDVIVRTVDNLGCPTHMRYKWKGTDIIGVRQLSHLLCYEVEQRIKNKYFDKELKILLRDIKLVKPTLEQLKQILQYVDFVTD